MGQKEKIIIKLLLAITISLGMLTLGSASEQKIKENFLNEDIALSYFKQGKILTCLDNDNKAVIVSNTKFKPLRFMGIVMFTDLNTAFAGRSCILYHYRISD